MQLGVKGLSSHRSGRPFSDWPSRRRRLSWTMAKISPKIDDVMNINWLARVGDTMVELVELTKEEIEKIDKMSPAEFVEYFKSISKPYFDRQYRYGYEWITKADTGAIISWLRQGTWNEWVAVNLLGTLIKDYTDYVDPEFYPLFSRQIADECRHVLIRHNLLKKYGGTMEGFTPLEEWVRVFELPLKLALEKPEFFQLRFTSVLQVGEWASVSHHRGVVAGAGDKHPELRAVFKEILDDELFHWSIAERTWLKMCDTLEKKLDVIRITQNYTLPVLDAAKRKRLELALQHKI
jgi:hypothetical protein